MIVICEECGKKYDIDPAQIKGREAKAKCKSCGHVITVTKKEVNPSAAAPPSKVKEAPPRPKEPEARGLRRGLLSQTRKLLKRSRRKARLLPRKALGCGPRSLSFFSLSRLPS